MKSGREGRVRVLKGHKGGGEMAANQWSVN